MTYGSYMLQGCALIVRSLHTEGTENPYTPNYIRAAQISMNTTQISPRHPQTSSGNMTCQQATTDTKGLCQTYSNSLSWGVCWCLLASVGVCWHIVFTVDAMGLSGECLGGV